MLRIALFRIPRFGIGSPLFTICEPFGSISSRLPEHTVAGGFRNLFPYGRHERFAPGVLDRDPSPWIDHVGSRDGGHVVLLRDRTVVGPLVADLRLESAYPRASPASRFTPTIMPGP